MSANAPPPLSFELHITSFLSSSASKYSFLFPPHFQVFHRRLFPLIATSTLAFHLGLGGFFVHQHACNRAFSRESYFSSMVDSGLYAIQEAQQYIASTFSVHTFLLGVNFLFAPFGLLIFISITSS